MCLTTRFTTLTVEKNLWINISDVKGKRFWFGISWYVKTKLLEYSICFYQFTHQFSVSLPRVLSRWWPNSDRRGWYSIDRVYTIACSGCWCACLHLWHVLQDLTEQPCDQVPRTSWAVRVGRCCSCLVSWEDRGKCSTPILHRGWTVLIGTVAV